MKEIHDCESTPDWPCYQTDNTLNLKPIRVKFLPEEFFQLPQNPSVNFHVFTSFGVGILNRNTRQQIKPKMVRARTSEIPSKIFSMWVALSNAAENDRKAPIIPKTTPIFRGRDQIIIRISPLAFLFSTQGPGWEYPH